MRDIVMLSKVFSPVKSIEGAMAVLTFFLDPCLKNMFFGPPKIADYLLSYSHISSSFLNFRSSLESAFKADFEGILTSSGVFLEEEICI